ncbi:DUF6443 domain-containing protein [Winogradskyella sp. 4-2091]|uniref:DUF6443 domain-containing protein n=1 Tax=Winogradskyella sp. 4-2091 TaxID=3381659 RepID=UPI00389141FA
MKKHILYIFLFFSLIGATKLTQAQACVDSYKNHKLVYLGNETSAINYCNIAPSDSGEKYNLWLQSKLEINKVYRINGTYYYVKNAYDSQSSDEDYTLGSSSYPLSVEPAQFCNYASISNPCTNSTYKYHKMINVGTTIEQAVNYCNYDAGPGEGTKYNISLIQKLQQNEIYKYGSSYYFVIYSSNSATSDEDETISNGDAFQLQSFCDDAEIGHVDVTSNENYILNITYKQPFQSPEAINLNVTDDDKNESITYYDGLGRAKQSIIKHGGGNGENILTPIVYDEFGRQSKNYLPYAYTSGNSSLDYVNNSTVLNNLNDYYLNEFPESQINSTTINAYSENIFEDSPLNRVLEQGSPGSAWESNNGHTVKLSLKTNGFDEVKQFSVYHSNDDTEQTNLIYDGFYSEKQLNKIITKDENWQINQLYNKDHTSEEFRNNHGQVVLKRTYVNNEKHDTYYVYDDYGNLTYVLPPEASDEILVLGDQQFRVASQTNYSWVNLANVDAEFAEQYNKELSDYSNASILNADIENAYNGQGGFTVTTFSDSDLVTLNISFSVLEALDLKKGELLSLKAYGNYKDTELGELIGADYAYYFSIKNNSIYIEGEGKLSAINQSYSSTQTLSYRLNYTWPMLSAVDADFAKNFDDELRDYAKQNNLSPLNVYLENEYGAQGGLQVLVDDDDNVTLNFNVNSNTSLSLNSDLSIALDLKRRLTDRSLGSISGQGFSYEFYLKDNTLYARGEGVFTIFNGNLFSSPILTDSIIELETIEGLCYIYHYDSRNRLIEKKIPGKDWEHIVYNKLDMPILTQDGKQRLDGIWLFTKYDVFGRVVYTGTYKDGRNDRYYIQNTLVNNHITQYESKTTSATIMSDNTAVYYTADAFPNNGAQEILTINYYDDYNFNIPSELGGFQNTYSQTTATNTKTLATGSKVRVLDTDSWITTISYYDNKARPIYVTSYNAYLNTIDNVSSQLDFVGNVEETASTHIKDSNSPITIEDRFTYDHVGRLLTQVQIIENNEELIVNNHYDELGQLKRKDVGGVAASSAPEESQGLQSVDYSYNIRGWLKTINNDNYSDNDLFNFELRYNNPLEGTALFNGNISETYWETANDNNLRGYDYSYDALNRIKLANYHGDYELVDYLGQYEDYSIITASDAAATEEGIKYDKNGNIMRLTRMGLQDSNNQVDIIDDLVYTYAPKSNKLVSVNDNGTDDGFKDGNSGENDYLYDINGNMTQDLNKGITDIEYNYFNLPTKVEINGPLFTSEDHNGIISYVYDATGVKLEKRVDTYYSKNIISVEATQYAGGFIYEKNGNLSEQPSQLKFFTHPEGYIEPNNSGTYNYVYQYKDHLGNIRLTYADSDGNGSIDASTEIISEKNYYPFGMTQSGYNNVVSANANFIGEKFGFNGMEMQDELGLNSYDFGWRNYDAALGRWFGIDPLAEFMPRVSTYSYAFNNPILFIDVAGMLPMGPGDRIQAAKKSAKNDKRTYAMVSGSAAYNDDYVDCSEFALEIALLDGYNPGRDSRSQASYYQGNGIWLTSPSQIKAGDFLFWRKPGTTRISHTGIVTRINSDGTLHIIQSTVNGGGVSINGKSNASSDGTLWKGTKYQLDFVGAGRPASEPSRLDYNTETEYKDALRAFVSESNRIKLENFDMMETKEAAQIAANRPKVSSVVTITPAPITPIPILPSGTINPIPIPIPTPSPSPTPNPSPMPIVPPTPRPDSGNGF